MSFGKQALRPMGRGLLVGKAAAPGEIATFRVDRPDGQRFQTATAPRSAGARRSAVFGTALRPITQDEPSRAPSAGNTTAMTKTSLLGFGFAAGAAVGDSCRPE
jgi:hypothetical protein